MLNHRLRGWHNIDIVFAEVVQQQRQLQTATTDEVIKQ